MWHILVVFCLGWGYPYIINLVLACVSLVFLKKDMGVGVGLVVAYLGLIRAYFVVFSGLGVFT